MQQETGKTITRARLPLTKTQHRLAWVLAGLPLALEFFFLIINPPYPTLVFRTRFQLCGWALVAAMLILPGLAYITLIGGFALLNQLKRPSRTLHFILVIGVFLLFVFPAIDAVLFGPATLTLMESGVLNTVR